MTELTQRFTHNGTNELEYTGVDPVLVSFTASLTVNPSNNDRLAFRATKNGVTLDYSQAILEQGQGAGAAPRGTTVVALIQMMPGDTVGLAVANLETTNDVPWLSATYKASA